MYVRIYKLLTSAPNWLLTFFSRYCQYNMIIEINKSMMNYNGVPGLPGHLVFSMSVTI